MRDSNKIYDVCFISISDIKSDARTLNIARVLSKNGKSVSIIAFGDDKDMESFQSEGIDFFRVDEIDTGKAYKRWLHFIKSAKRHNNIYAKLYWASDFFSLFTANKFARKFRAKIYYDSREIYSRVGSLSNNAFKQYIQTKLELRWVKNVDRVIVSGELDADYLKKHFKIDVPYHVIMNLPPYREKVNADLLRENFSILKDKKIILYQGMLMMGRGIIPVVSALQFLDNVVFCLLGTGNYKDQIFNHAKELGVDDRVMFCGHVDYDELHNWTSSADIANCLIEPISFCNELALPNKMFEYCMAGIPSIISDLPAMKKIIDEYPFGKIIPRDSSPKEIAEAIKEVLKDENHKKYKENCEEAAKIFSYENQEKIILEIFDEL
ncbi:glycosyltransferase [Bacteroidota bacterium]